MASHFENEMDETRTVSVVEKYEPAVENEDESDQAKASWFYPLFLSPFCYLFFFSSRHFFFPSDCSITWRVMRSTI